VVWCLRWSTLFLMNGIDGLLLIIYVISTRLVCVLFFSPLYIRQCSHPKQRHLHTMCWHACVTALVRPLPTAHWSISFCQLHCIASVMHDFHVLSILHCYINESTCFFCLNHIIVFDWHSPAVSKLLCNIRRGIFDLCTCCKLACQLLLAWGTFALMLVFPCLFILCSGAGDF